MKQHIKKKGKKESPALNTSSLPDIVFMLLFFFMVTTTMREIEMKVKLQLPDATEVQKLEKKSLVSYIYVGAPMEAFRAKLGDATRIQLNDAFCSVEQIGEFIASERDKLDETDRPKLTTSLKVDRMTRMGVITDIKMALRRANALNISYAAKRKDVTANQ